jgi:hypothetical protein
MPLVDQVIGLRFEYFDADGQLIVMGDLPTARGFQTRCPRIVSMPTCGRSGVFVRMCDCGRHGSSRPRRSGTSKLRSMYRRAI